MPCLMPLATLSLPSWIPLLAVFIKTSGSNVVRIHLQPGISKNESSRCRRAVTDISRGLLHQTNAFLYCCITAAARHHKSKDCWIVLQFDPIKCYYFCINIHVMGIWSASNRQHRLPGLHLSGGHRLPTPSKACNLL